NTTISLARTSSGLDGDTLTNSATGLPSGLSAGPRTGDITGTLSYTSAGSHTMTATVSDGTLTASQTFTWTVTNVNRAPTLSAVKIGRASWSETMSLAMSGTDVEGEPPPNSAPTLATSLNS